MRLVLCLWLLCHPALGWSPRPPETPQIPTQQQTERTLENEKGSGADTECTTVLAPTLPVICTPIGERERQRYTEQGQKEGSEFWTIFGRRLKITDTLIAVFTFLLFWATRRLVTGAEKTAERQLRAYLSVEPTRIPPPDDWPRQRIDGELLIHNSGQTPGYGVTVVPQTGVFPLDWDPRGTLPVARNDRAATPRHTIGANGNLQSTVRSDAPLDEGAMRAIRDGSQRLYVYGTIWYEDVFEKTRRTNFCYDIQLIGNEVSVVANAHGNDEAD